MITSFNVAHAAPAHHPFPARCYSLLFPFWNSPPTQHSAFFSTTYAVPILQVLLFDIHPSNGGVYSLAGPAATVSSAFLVSSFQFRVSSFQFLLQNPLNVSGVDFHGRRPRNQVQGKHHA